MINLNLPLGSSYNTCYGAESLNEDKDKGLNVSYREGGACFGCSNFGQFRGHQRYTIKIYRGVFPGHSNNFCFLPIESVIKHIESINLIWEDSLIINSLTEDNKGGLTVVFEFKHEKNVAHRFALTWFRFLYESPYNLALMDAYSLDIPELDCFQKFHLVAGSFTGYYWGTGHSMTRTVGVNYPAKELKRRMNKVDNLNRIYDGAPCINPKQIPSTYDGLSISKLGYWVSDKCKKIRIDIYKESLKQGYGTRSKA